MFKNAKNIIILFLLFIIYKMIKHDAKSRKKFIDAENSLYMLKEWQNRRNEGIKVADYFARNGHESVIIYGAGTYGETLMHELKDTGINVRFFINSTEDYFNVGCSVILLKDLKPEDINEGDVIVVTPIEYYAQIVKDLREKIDCKIISLEEVINLC